MLPGRSRRTAAVAAAAAAVLVLACASAALAVRVEERDAEALAAAVGQEQVAAGSGNGSAPLNVTQLVNQTMAPEAGIPVPERVAKMPDFFFHVFARLKNQTIASFEKYQSDMKKCQEEAGRFEKRAAAAFDRQARLQMLIEQGEHYIRALPAQITDARNQLPALEGRIANLTVMVQQAEDARTLALSTLSVRQLETQAMLFETEELIKRLRSAASRLGETQRANATQATSAQRNASESSGPRLPTLPDANSTRGAVLVETEAEAEAEAEAASTEGMPANVAAGLLPHMEDLVGHLLAYQAEVTRDLTTERALRGRVVASLRAELMVPTRDRDNRTLFIRWANETLVTAQEQVPLMKRQLEDVRNELRQNQPLLDKALDKCQAIHAQYIRQKNARDEQLETLRALNHVVGVELGELPPLRLPPSLLPPVPPQGACFPNPCVAGTMCVPQNCDDMYFNSVPGNESSDSGRPSSGMYCIGYRCDPVSDRALRNPCLSLPCPPNSRCVPEQEQYCASPPCLPFKCVSLNPFTQDFSTAPATCQEIRHRARARRVTLESGVYLLTDPADELVFPAYCDMETDDGGWMLAFKQRDFSSGSAKYDVRYRGASALQTPNLNATARASLMGYGKPTQMLFRTSDKDSWFIVPALDSWQYWSIEPSARTCFYRPYHRAGDVKVSPKWDYSRFDLWLDMAIELMMEVNPLISAITVGKERAFQHLPQCMEPHCSPFRHGRYNGNCTNTAVGEGNWLIFVR